MHLVHLGGRSRDHTSIKMAADKPAQPGAHRGAKERAGNVAVAQAARDKLHTRERQSTFVAGALAMRIERDVPGRIHCIKVATTRYKTVTTIVFDRSKRACALPLDEDDGYDTDDSGNGDEPMGEMPVPHNAAANSAKAQAPTSKATTESSAGAGGQVGTQGAWQQPRKPAKQQPSKAARPVAKQVAAKVSRNTLSARSGEKRPAKPQQPPTLEAAQIHALAKSVNAISKEVCPTSTFTVRRKVPIGGVEMELQLVPSSLAGETARQNPKYLGGQLEECWRAGDGATVREILTPVDPMQQDTSSSPGPSSRHPPEPTPPPSAGAVPSFGGVVQARGSSAASDDELGFDLFK